MRWIIVETVLPLIGTFLVGAFGWWVTHWIASPLLELGKTRQQTYELLLFYRHLFKDWSPDKISEAENRLRSMAARIGAIWMTASKLIRWYCHFRGWDFVRAQSALHGLANVLANSRDQIAILRHEIETALRFPLEDTAERIRRLEKRIDRNGA